MTTIPEQRADWRSKHREVDGLGYPMCVSCAHDWPCPTTQLLADLEAVETALREIAEDVFDPTDTATRQYKRLRSIARAALGEGESK